MNTIKFIPKRDNQNLLFFEDESSRIFLPSDQVGDYQQIVFESIGYANYATDGINIYALNHNSGLGWIAQAITSAGSLVGSLIGSRTQRKANESAERQLALQNQSLAIQERIAQINSQRTQDVKSNLPLIAGVLGFAFLGITFILIVNSNNKTKASAKQNDILKKEQK